LQKLYRHSSITTTIGYQSNFINKKADDALDAVLCYATEYKGDSMKTKTTATQTPGTYVREKILQAKNISVTDMAKILGVGRPTLSNFINGKAALLYSRS
jgi:phage antirepressor YoqD-like protein